MKKMYLTIILLIIIIAGLGIWRSLQKSIKNTPASEATNSQINKQAFSCSSLKEIAFDYTLSGQWQVNRVEEQRDGCKIYLAWGKSLTPSLPYIYVNKILIDGLPNFTEINPQGILYQQGVQQPPGGDKNPFLTDATDFLVSDYIVRVGLQLGNGTATENLKPFDRNLFWHTVIQSFKKSQ